MAVTRKYDDVMVVQMESDPMGLVIRKIAEDSEVSAAEVCRQIIAKGLPGMADYEDALMAVQEGWRPKAAASSRAAGKVKRRARGKVSARSSAA